MKFALAQTAIPTSNTTFDFTDANIASDFKGAIFFGSNATANDTQDGAARLFLGATDAVRSAGLLLSIADATAGARSLVYPSNAACILRNIPSNGTVNVLGAYSSTLSNGVRCALSSNDATAHLFNALLFAGSDCEFGVSTQAYIGTDTSKSFAHNLTGAPDAMLVLIANATGTFGTGAEGRATIGFWDGTNAAGWGFNQTSLANPTTLAAMLTADLGHSIVSLADHATWSVGSVGASNVTLNRSAAGGDAACAIVIAWRATSGTAGAKAVAADSATATGNQAILSGMAVQPQMVIALPTRLTSNTLTTDDSTGSFGLCVAVNNGGSTEQANVTCASKDAVATSVAKSYINITKFIQIADTSVALADQATLQSWDSGGVTVNWSTVDGSARKVAMLGYGVSQGGGFGLSQLNNQGGF